MAALAGIGEAIPDTIVDRSIVIRMRRRAHGESVSTFRIRRDEPVLLELRQRVADWIDPHVETLSSAEPDLPVEDRAADAWEPLVAVADRAGGSWPYRARQACKHIVDDAVEDEVETSLSRQLLADLRAVFGDQPRLYSAVICEELGKLEGSPWSDWYGRPFGQRDLARLLTNYRVKPRLVKLDGKTLRGYQRDDFDDVWVRYLPPVGGGSATPVTGVTPQVSDVPQITGNAQDPLPVAGNPQLPLPVTAHALSDLHGNPGNGRNADSACKRCGGDAGRAGLGKRGLCINCETTETTTVKTNTGDH
jgi:hypothetical protein